MGFLLLKVAWQVLFNCEEPFLRDGPIVDCEAELSPEFEHAVPDGSQLLRLVQSALSAMHCWMTVLEASHSLLMLYLGLDHLSDVKRRPLICVIEDAAYLFPGIYEGRIGNRSLYIVTILVLKFVISMRGLGIYFHLLLFSVGASGFLLVTVLVK